MPGADELDAMSIRWYIHKIIWDMPHPEWMEMPMSVRTLAGQSVVLLNLRIVKCQAEGRPCTHKGQSIAIPRNHSQ